MNLAKLSAALVAAAHYLDSDPERLEVRVIAGEQNASRVLVFSSPVFPTTMPIGMIVFEANGPASITKLVNWRDTVWSTTYLPD